MGHPYLTNQSQGPSVLSRTHMPPAPPPYNPSSLLSSTQNIPKKHPATIELLTPAGEVPLTSSGEWLFPMSYLPHLGPNNPEQPPPPSMMMMMPPLAPLCKHRSWSPDIYRDEAWLRRKGENNNKRRSKSVTEEDVDELKACIELGFGFEIDLPELDQRLSHTLPALGLYYAVNKNYNDTVSISASSLSDSDSISIPSPIGSPHTILSPGDPPQTVKTRLKQWAQVVACSVRQSSR